ncbi:MAG: hypothetical protein O7H41_02340 [Planctomycetota bacterium]|nr:hypothetical protein [Planctomycetota bacterium]
MGVLMLLPVFMVGLAAYSERGMTQMQAAILLNKQVRATYIAEGAIQKAALQLINDPTFRGVRTNTTLGKGDYTYKITGSETYDELGAGYRVVAVGTINDPVRGDVRKRIVAILETGGQSVLDFPAGAKGSVSIVGGAVIGSVTDNDNVVYCGNRDPSTAAYALYGTGSATIHGSARLATAQSQVSLPIVTPGTVEYGVDPVAYPTYDINSLRTKAQNNTSNPQYPTGAYFVGDTTFSDETLRGVVFVEGGDLLLNGTVIVDAGCIIHLGSGSFEVKADVTLTPDMNPVTGARNVAIIKAGGGLLKFWANRIADIEGFIFATGNLVFNANGEVRGGLISHGDIALGGTCTIYFHQLNSSEIADEVRIPGGMRLSAWREDDLPAVVSANDLDG